MVKVLASLTVLASSSCSNAGVSCASTPFFTYGYISIPLMALTAFILIIIFMLSVKKKEL